MQTIEARAILSASDKTGGIFSQIAAKIKGMNSAAAAANRTAASTSRSASAAAAVAARANNSSNAANAAIIGAASRVMAPAALATGAYKAYKNFADTDLQVRRIGITADASEAEVSKLSKTLRDLAQGTGQSFDKVAKGLDSMVAGGMDLKDALPALPAIAKTAQASGAEVEDMATTTLALNQNLKIATDSMQNAFDVLVKGGKEGKFELKDMAKYFPSIAPAAVAIGMKGEEGLMRIVAALQTIRNGTGTTEEAADSMQNIFAKMESEETTKKFKKFGIDLRKEMETARGEGKDLLQVFTELSEKAIKGDLSKVPQLFSDMQFARGMRALLSFKDLNAKVMDSLRTSAGSTAVDFQKVMSTPAIAMARLREAVDRNVNAIGQALENLPKKFTEGGKGLTELLNDKAKEVNEKGFKGLFDASTQKDIEAAEKFFEYLTSARKQIEFGLRFENEKPYNEKQTPDTEVGKRRLKLLDLQRADELKEQMEDLKKRQLFTDSELAMWRKSADKNVEEISKPAGQQTRLVGQKPMPQPDPRKAAMPEAKEAPPVQPLDTAPAVQPLDDVVNAINGIRDMNVKAELSGTADVKGETTVKVQVEAGSELLRIVDSVKNAVANMAGKLTANSPGGTGRSSPDAAPNSLNTGMPLP